MKTSEEAERQTVTFIDLLPELHMFGLLPRLLEY
jgi:hypothetical protein